MSKRPRRQTICLDFDGVLHSYESGWKGPRNIPDPIVPGAAVFLLDAVSMFDVVVLSARSRYVGGRWAMKRWLRRELARVVGKELHEAIGTDVAMDRDTAKFIARGTVKDIRWPSKKIPASVYIDDRGYTFKGQWPSTRELKRFKPWNK